MEYDQGQMIGWEEQKEYVQEQWLVTGGWYLHIMAFNPIIINLQLVTGFDINTNFYYGP